MQVYLPKKWEGGRTKTQTFGEPTPKLIIKEDLIHKMVQKYQHFFGAHRSLNSSLIGFISICYLSVLRISLTLCRIWWKLNLCLHYVLPHMLNILCIIMWMFPSWVSRVLPQVHHSDRWVNAGQPTDEIYRVRRLRLWKPFLVSRPRDRF